MPAVPTFILKKLYVAGSLQNTAEGCQLQIKNTLAPGTIIGVNALTVDGVSYKPDTLDLVKDGARRSAAEISGQRPAAFNVNDIVTIVVRGVTLAPGEHRIGLDIMTREAGRLNWEISDRV